jgi:hypothetical protein
MKSAGLRFPPSLISLILYPAVESHNFHDWIRIQSLQTNSVSASYLGTYFGSVFSVERSLICCHHLWWRLYAKLWDGIIGVLGGDRYFWLFPLTSNTRYCILYCYFNYNWSIIHLRLFNSKMSALPLPLAFTYTNATTAARPFLAKRLVLSITTLTWFRCPRHSNSHTLVNYNHHCLPWINSWSQHCNK